MRKFFVTRLRLLIQMLPFGHDVFLHFNRKRMGISFRGRYPDYRSALDDADESKNEYDVVNRNKSQRQAEEEALLDGAPNEYDYPPLFWITNLLRTGTRVLELGGQLDLSLESSTRRLRGRCTGVHELDGHTTTCRFLVGLVYGPHSPVRDSVDKLVSVKCRQIILA